MNEPVLCFSYCSLLLFFLFVLLLYFLVKFLNFIFEAFYWVFFCYKVFIVYEFFLYCWIIILQHFIFVAWMQCFPSFHLYVWSLFSFMMLFSICLFCSLFFILGILIMSVDPWLSASSCEKHKKRKNNVMNP